VSAPQAPLMHRVTKEECQAFLAAYPRPLERDVFAAFEPPLVTWNDFAQGQVWPASVVASFNGEHYQIVDALPEGD